MKQCSEVLSCELVNVSLEVTRNPRCLMKYQATAQHCLPVLWWNTGHTHGSRVSETKSNAILNPDPQPLGRGFSKSVPKEQNVTLLERKVQEAGTSLDVHWQKRVCAASARAPRMDWPRISNSKQRDPFKFQTSYTL